MSFGMDPRAQVAPPPAPTMQTALSGAQAQSGGTVSPLPTTTPSFQNYTDLFNLGQTAALPQTVAADNQIANLYNKVGLTGAQAGLQRGQIQQQAGFDRERLGMQQALLGDQKEDLGARRADIDYWHNRQMQNFMGGQAARGATHTEGTTRGIGDFENERARLLRNLGMDEKQLARTSKNLGIQEEELGSRVQNALDQIGLSQALNVSDIFTAIQDVEAGKFTPLSNILGMIYQLSGIRPIATPQPPPPPLPAPNSRDVRRA